MSRFTLTVFPSGHAVLSIPGDTDVERFEDIRNAFKEWRDGNPDVLFINADVIQAIDIELDVPEAA